MSEAAPGVGAGGAQVGCIGCSGDGAWRDSRDTVGVGGKGILKPEALELADHGQAASAEAEKQGDMVMVALQTTAIVALFLTGLEPALTGRRRQRWRSSGTLLVEAPAATTSLCLWAAGSK